MIVRSDIVIVCNSIHREFSAFIEIIYDGDKNRILLKASNKLGLSSVKLESSLVS